MSVESVRHITCYNAIEDVHEAVRGQLDDGQNYVMTGGIASAAIRHTESTFDHQNERLLAAPSSAESIIRPNGSLRDVDLVICDVATDEQKEAVKAAVAQAVRKTTGTDMVVSVFGFDRRREMKAVTHISGAALAWTSKRTVDERGVHRYELFPVEGVVDKRTYAPWVLGLPGGSEVSILNPAGHVLAYRMRSVSGLRYKDWEKVLEMDERIASQPEFIAAMTTGDFASWASFATTLERLKRGTLNPHSTRVRDGAGRADVMLARFKSQKLAAVESSEFILKVAQKEWAQKVLNFAIGAS